LPAGELKTLSESGITAISLATNAPAQGMIQGNTILCPGIVITRPSWRECDYGVFDRRAAPQFYPPAQRQEH
jgi:hypothetical protein